jgi:hypothetical protein
VTEDSFEDDRLPDDLQSVADALRAHRDEPDGHLLERVFHRVRASSPGRRRRRLLTARSAVMATAAAALVLGVRLSHLNLAQAATTLASSVTSITSTSPSGSAANHVYCPSGVGGWAPTFRWHYGAPAPDSLGFDDGYSPSVQPDCAHGTLTINLTDRVTVPVGASFWAGFDFHTANQPTYTMSARQPTVVLNLSCASGSANPSTFTYTWAGNTYQSQANTWVPDNNNKTALSGFQSGAFTLPKACGTKSVIVTGGTFTASITAS